LDVKQHDAVSGSLGKEKVDLMFSAWIPKEEGKSWICGKAVQMEQSPVVP